MIDSIHAFLDEKCERLQGGVATPEEIRDMVTELIEMAKRDEREFYSQYIRLVKHLLKYKFQLNKQSRSWITTIRDSSNELSLMLDDKFLINKVSLDLISKYDKAKRSAAGETILPLSTFPNTCPVEWSIDNLADYDWIESFLMDNAVSSEAKRVLGLG